MAIVRFIELQLAEGFRPSAIERVLRVQGDSTRRIADAEAAWAWSVANPGPLSSKIPTKGSSALFYQDLYNPDVLTGYRAMLKASPIPAVLRPVTALSQADATLTREFSLRRLPNNCPDSVWMINDLGWDEITERPRLESTEIWSFINKSGFSHPMHMHLVQFQVLDRQPFTIVAGQVVPSGPPVARPPEIDVSTGSACAEKRTPHSRPLADSFSSRREGPWARS